MLLTKGFRLWRVHIFQESRYKRSLLNDRRGGEQGATKTAAQGCKIFLLSTYKAAVIYCFNYGSVHLLLFNMLNILLIYKVWQK